MLPCHAMSRAGARARPRVARGGSVIVNPGSRACLQERAGWPLGSPTLLLVPDDGGHVLSVDAVPVVVDVDLRRLPDRRARLWERLGGPHPTRGHGGGAGRGWPPVAPSPGEQGHQAGDPNAGNYHGDHEQNVHQFGGGSHDRSGLWPLAVARG
jgi:hypothetical protein